MNLNLLLACSLLFCQCTNPEIANEKGAFKAKKGTLQKRRVLPEVAIEKSTNLVDVQSVHSVIEVDLKYASTANFMHVQLYQKLKKAYLEKTVALRLAKCQDYLSQLHSNYHLLVYDALRPLSVQQKMWDSLDSIPFSKRVKFVSNPKNGSLHNYGAAVDLTISDEKGKPLDMGADFDDIRLIAYPEMEAHFLKTGELTTQQVENRKLLRKVLQSQGFRNLPTEWWHFNACSRKEAQHLYRLIEHE